jgi:hypothetical protein
MSQQPRYAHNCEECVFLGQHGEWDLYHCEEHSAAAIPGLIVRSGNRCYWMTQQRAEYLDMEMVCAAPQAVYTAAARLALQAGRMSKMYIAAVLNRIPVRGEAASCE